MYGCTDQRDHIIRAATPVKAQASVEVGKLSYIGTGASVVPDIKIEKWSIIGAGACVVKDVAPYSLMLGVPAKTKLIFENFQKRRNYSKKKPV